MRRFVSLLYEAHDASRTVDYFDFHSEDEKNRRAFAKLKTAQWKTAAKLIRFAQKHGDLAIEGLGVS